MVEAEHLRCCMLCWHVASPYFSRRQKPGFGVWKRRYCIGPLSRDCTFAHELQLLCMPLRDPSGRGYDDEFFQTQVGIYVGQQYRPCLKRMVVAYARGVPSHELPLWYKLFQWVENGYPADWPEVLCVWDFGYYQLVNEWLRSQGIRRLPFDTRWLRNALRCRRVYLGSASSVPLAGLSLGILSAEDQAEWDQEQEEAEVKQELEAEVEEALRYLDSLEESEVEQEVEAEEEEALRYDEALEEADVELDEEEEQQVLAILQYMRWKKENFAGYETVRILEDEPQCDDAGPGSSARGSVGHYTRLRLKRERMETEHRQVSRSLRRRLRGKYR